MAINKNSLANLVPDNRFKAGEEWTGNSLGKPKGTLNRTTIYRQLLQAPVKSLRNTTLTKQLENLGLSDNATIEELLLAKHITLSTCGKPEVELRAIEMAQDNAYGKLTQTNVNANAEIDLDKMHERLNELKRRQVADY